MKPCPECPYEDGPPYSRDLWTQVAAGASPTCHMRTGGFVLLDHSFPCNGWVNWNNGGNPPRRMPA